AGRDRDADGRRGAATGEAALRLTVPIAAVPTCPVPVVAYLTARVHEPIAALEADLRLAGGRAAVTAPRVPVVALLAGGDDAVAAARPGAARVAAVAVGQVPVVATLAPDRLE